MTSKSKYRLFTFVAVLFLFVCSAQAAELAKAIDLYSYLTERVNPGDVVSDADGKPYLTLDIHSDLPPQALAALKLRVGAPGILKRVTIHDVISSKLPGSLKVTETDELYLKIDWTAQTKTKLIQRTDIVQGLLIYDSNGQWVFKISSILTMRGIAPFQPKPDVGEAFGRNVVKDSAILEEEVDRWLQAVLKPVLPNLEDKLEEKTTPH